MSLYDRYQLGNALRDKEERERDRLAEIVHLETAGPTAAEYRQAVDEMHKSVVDPYAELSDCSFRDYRLRRAAGEGK